jgi:CRISPR-associated protein Csb2
MFALRVEFPSGRYLAASGNDPAVPEWPPHPSRLFSALVAAAYQLTGGMTAARRNALEWLESQPYPSIFAPHADLQAAAVSYVPPGDCVERKGKKGEERYEHPIHRWRQPRHFPEARILGEAAVQFFWGTDPDVNILSTLTEIAEGVSHVGTSHSMALVRVVADSSIARTENYVPDPAGTLSLRTTMPGRLAELDRVFVQSSGVRTPFPLCEKLVGYRFGEAPPPLDKFHEVLCLAIEGPRYALTDTHVLMRAIRAALMGVLKEDAPEALHGHSHSPHVAWLPLADVGHSYATGLNMGVGLAIPVVLSAEERLSLLRGLALLPFVRLPDGRQIQLRAIPASASAPQALQERTWCAASCVWATVTPVVLDRPPRKADGEKVKAALSASLVLAGYPAPKEIEISNFSVFNGAPFAIDFPSATPRYHAVIHFAELVAGPVMAGRQRHFGVGVFRPYHPPRDAA